MKVKYDKILGRLREKDKTISLNPTGEAKTELIYDENQEWQTAKAEATGFQINFDAEGTPAHGNKHINLRVNAGFLLGSVIEPNSKYATLLETVESFDPAAIHSAAPIFPDKNSDVLVGNIRTITWYEALNTDVSFYAISKTDGTRYDGNCPFINLSHINITELDFSKYGIDSFILVASGEQPLPESAYDIYISFDYVKHVDTYQMLAVDGAVPAGGSLSFTRAASIEATGGKISLSIKNLVGWLPSTDLNIDLFNQTERVGTLTINAANLHGLDPANTTDYQRIDLPMTDFNLFGNFISRMVVRPSGSWPAGSFLFDWIVLTSASLTDNFQSIIDQLNQNIINAGDLITNELKSYVGDLINNLTITWEQITGSPVLNQEFKDYISNLLENLTVKWEQIIGSPVLNQTLIDLLNQYRTGIIQQIENIVVGDTVTNALKTYIDNLLTEIRNQLTEVTNATTINQTLLTEIQNQITEIDQIVQYITKGDTITQEYKDYLEQKFTTIQQTIQNITEGAVITEEIKQYIDDSLTELTTLLQQYIDNSVGEAITNNTTITGEATRLISGTITWIENLDFLVSPLVYQILNRIFRTGIENLITIPANTENKPRFAVIYADIFGNVGYILGTAAPAPAVPHVNDSTQIALTTIYIAALGTIPTPDPDGETGDIETVVIYDENIEWTTTKVEETGMTIDLAATTSPQHGTKHIALTVAASGEPGGFENLGLQTNVYTGDFFASLGILGGSNTFGLALDTLFPANKTDILTGDIRTLTWYKVSRQDVSGYAISQTSGERFNLSCSFVNSTIIDKRELNLLTQTSTEFILEADQDLVNGKYDINLTVGHTQYIQQFKVLTTGGLITPSAAKITFTAPEAVSILGGSISLSLKQSAAWLASTGLILELYNAAAKVGSLSIVPGSLQGFNPANSEYQRLTISVADFTPTAAQITALVIRPVNEWPNSVLDIDNIRLQIDPNQTGLAVADHIEDISFEYRDISEAGQVYTIDPAASYGYRVKEIVLRTTAGNVTAKLKINNTDITGLSAVASTNANQTFKATALNNLVKEDILTLETVSVTNGATAIIGKVRYIRN
jgi:polyhydroxyalkanoate synthesis regulator phasin